MELSRSIPVPGEPVAPSVVDDPPTPQEEEQFKNGLAAIEEAEQATLKDTDTLLEEVVLEV